MKNFSGVCQAAGADKPLRAFFIWITNIVTLYGQAETFYCIVDSLYRFGDSFRNSLCQCQHRQ